MQENLRDFQCLQHQVRNCFSDKSQFNNTLGSLDETSWINSLITDLPISYDPISLWLCL